METTLDARTLRVKIAESGILNKQFAEMAGLAAPYLSNILHEREPIWPGVRVRLEAALEELERNPPERRIVRRGPGRPRRKRAEQLRAEQLASGCEQAVRYL